MNIKIIIVILILGSLLALVIIMFRLLGVRGKRLFQILKEISTRFEGSTVKRPIGYYFGEYTINPWFLKGKYNGYKFKLDSSVSKIPRGGIVDGKEDTIFISLFLYLHEKSKMKILIYDKAPGRIFMVKRVLTGDNNLDERIHIYSNKSEQAKRYFHDKTVQSAVSELLSLKWTNIVIEDKRCYISRNINMDELNFEYIENTLNNMLAFKPFWSNS